MYCLTILSQFVNIQEPVGVIVLENCTVSYDEKGTEGMFSFFIQFNGDSDTYVFSCFNITQAQNWVIALRQAR